MLEEKLRPPVYAIPWPRDLVGIALLVSLAAVLLPAYGVTLHPQDPRYVNDVAGQMASPYLLLALGFSLALRCGAIDLSVYAAAGLGGLLGAMAIRSGVRPELAMALAGAGGLALGAFNGIATAILRIPSLLTTLFSAATVTYLLPYATTLRDPRVAATAFDDWCNSANMPPMMLRMFLVIGLYAATLLAMLFADSRYSSGRLRRRTELFGALCVSGALSGLGGGIWLIDQSMTPLPFRMVGDLRVVAAAVLAGAAFFGGRGRGMLAGVCLPVALLTATVWRQIVAVLPWYGYDMQLALLMAMAILTQRGLSDAVSATRGRKAHFVAASALMWGGLLTLALSAAAPPASLKTFHAAGLCIFLAGAVLLLIARGLHSHDKALAR